MKRFLIGALKLIGLFIIASIVAGISPEVGQIVGIVAVVVGGIAVIKPLPQVGLGHRGFAFLVALLIGSVGLTASMSIEESRIEKEAEVMRLAELREAEATRLAELREAEATRLAELREAEATRLAELRVSDPDSYLAELRSADEDRWLNELEELRPSAFQAEMDRRAKQAAERAVVEAARAEEERLAKVAEEERRAQTEEAARAAEAERAENERLAESAKAEEERLAKAAEAAEARTDLASPPEPVHVQSRRWETHCEPQCRTFTLADFRVFSESPPTKLMLEINPYGRILVSALDTEAQHRKFYTNRAPIELRRGPVNYVPARSFFNDRFAADLTIGGSKVAHLSTYDESHLGGELTDGLLARLRAGSRAELVFVSLMRGKGQRVTFSLLGFTKAYDARTDSPEVNAPASADARSIIAASLKGNQFKLKSGGLQERPNPRGEGVFVFFPEMEIAGHKRLFVWFVHGDQAVALNGPSKTATPSLPFPRDVSFRFWTGTGVSVDDATSVGLAVAFK